MRGLKTERIQCDEIWAFIGTKQNIDQIASVTTHPELVVGLHFFSPANVMRLLEIVRGGRTDDATLATAFAAQDRSAEATNLLRRAVALAPESAEGQAARRALEGVAAAHAGLA